MNLHVNDPLRYGSTGQLTYTPSTYPLASLSVAIVDADGTAVSVAGSVTADATNERYTITLSSSELPTSLAGPLKVTWTLTSGTQTRTDVEYVDLIYGDEPLLPMLKEELGFSLDDTDDDAMLARLLSTVKMTLDKQYGLPDVPSVTETRYILADGGVVFLDDCTAVTAVTDSPVNGTAVALTYETRADKDGFVRIMLESAYSGLIAVTGTWGHDDWPADVAEAIVLTASTWYRRRKFGQDGNYIGRLDSVPFTARDILLARKAAMF